MAVEYWLVNGNDKLRLPVNPEANIQSLPFAYEDFEVESLGEVTNIKRRGLRSFSIDSFFPRDYNPTYCAYNGFDKPHDLYNKLINWRNERKPIRYIVTGAGRVNTLVTIRDIQVRAEEAGNPGDIYYSLELKEYREVKITIVDLTKKNTKQRPSAPKKGPAKSGPQNTTYVVKKNDSLWLIAKKHYGSGANWRKIYEVNKKVIGSNANALKPGQKLVIPK